MWVPWGAGMGAGGPQTPWGAQPGAAWARPVLSVQVNRRLLGWPRGCQLHPAPALAARAACQSLLGELGAPCCTGAVPSSGSTRQREVAAARVVVTPGCPAGAGGAACTPSLKQLPWTGNWWRVDVCLASLGSAKGWDSPGWKWAMLQEGRIPSHCIEAHPAGCKAGGAGGLPTGSAPAPELEGTPRDARGSRQPRAACPGLGSQPGTEQPDLCACRGALRGAPCPWGCGTRSPLLRFLPKMLGHPGSRAMETELSQPASPAGKGRRDGEAPLRAAAEPLCPLVSPARMRAFPGVAPPVLRGLRADAGAGGLLPCRLSSPRRVLLLWEGAGLGFPPFCLYIRLQPSLRFVPQFIRVGMKEMGLVVPWGPQDSLCPPRAGGFALKQLGTGRGTAKELEEPAPGSAGLCSLCLSRPLGAGHPGTFGMVLGTVLGTSCTGRRAAWLHPTAGIVGEGAAPSACRVGPAGTPPVLLGGQDVVSIPFGRAGPRRGRAHPDGDLVHPTVAALCCRGRKLRQGKAKSGVVGLRVGLRGEPVLALLVRRA